MMSSKLEDHPHCLPRAKNDDMRSRFPAHERKKLPVPVSPVIHAALRAIYAGGSKSRWMSDSYGRPLYKYETRSGHITFFCVPPPDFTSRFHPSIAIYYTPRLHFIHSGSLRYLVRNLSVETADIFLILMSRIVALDDPRKEIARISMEDIAKLRGVRIRHGSSQKLYEDFKAEVLRLADLRLTMGWRDYKTGGEVIFGRERPDRLLDILDIEYKIRGNTWTAFRFRCGQALSHFLDPEGLFWIGYYSRYLLRLSPYHDAFTKKLGTYWIMVGTVAGKKGLLPRATPRTIMDFCGEEVNWRNPGQTVDAFIASHQRLQDLGVLVNMPALEPPTRTRGYFVDWLETPLMVKLSEDLWQIRPSTGAGRLKSLAKKAAIKGIFAEQTRSEIIPETVKDLRANQPLIKRFRTDHAVHQAELAKALGISRQTLSNYERGLHSIPEDKALKILRFWQKKVKPVS